MNALAAFWQGFAAVWSWALGHAGDLVHRLGTILAQDDAGKVWSSTRSIALWFAADIYIIVRLIDWYTRQPNPDPAIIGMLSGAITALGGINVWTIKQRRDDDDPPTHPREE